MQLAVYQLVGARLGGMDSAEKAREAMAGTTARFIHFAKTAAKRVIRTHTFPEGGSPGIWSPSLRFQNAELGNSKIIAEPDITFGLFRV